MIIIDLLLRLALGGVVIANLKPMIKTLKELFEMAE